VTAWEPFLLSNPFATSLPPPCPDWIVTAFTKAFEAACNNTVFRLHFHANSQDEDVRVHDSVRGKRVEIGFKHLARLRSPGAADASAVVAEAAANLAKIVNDHDDKLFEGFEIVPDEYEEELNGKKVKRSRFMKRDKRWGGSYRGMKDEESAIYRGWMGSDPELVAKRKAEQKRKLEEAEREAAEASLREQEERARKMEERRERAKAKLDARRAKAVKKAEERAAAQAVAEKFYEAADDYGMF
jgi:hypothetical protein